MLKYKILLFILSGILFYLLTASNFFEKKTIKIGVLTNVEGKDSELSLAGYNALKLSYEKHKKNLPKIKFVLIDESFNPEKIKKSYNKIKDNCDIFFLLTTSTAFLSVYPDIVKNNKKLHMIVGPTTSEISKINDNVIRTGLDSNQTQAQIAEFIKSRAKKLHVLIESDVNHSFTSPAFDFFNKIYKTPFTNSRFSANKLNFEKSLLDIKNENPDFVYIIAGATPGSTGLLIQKIHYINPNTKILVLSWVWCDLLKETMGNAYKNVIVNHQIDINNNLCVNFKKNFLKTYKSNICIFAVLSYDAGNILFSNISKNSIIDFETLKNNILSEKYTGNIGKIAFDEYGDAKGTMYFYSINNSGDLVPYEK